jgi:hypothetical protein
MFKKIRTILRSTDKTPASGLPGNLELLYESAKEGFEEFVLTLEMTAQELDFVPEASQSTAVGLVDLGKRQLPALEEEWNTLRQQRPVSEDDLQAFISRMADVSGKLSILVERGIHRKNLGILEQMLALQQSALTEDQLQTTLRPQMDFEIEAINRLESRKRLDPVDAETVAIHRNNLRIYQEMLSGQRPYAPLHLVNSVTFEEQAIQEIDHRLARL